MYGCGHPYHVAQVQSSAMFWRHACQLINILPPEMPASTECFTFHPCTRGHHVSAVAGWVAPCEGSIRDTFAWTANFHTLRVYKQIDNQFSELAWTTLHSGQSTNPGFHYTSHCSECALADVNSAPKVSGCPVLREASQGSVARARLLVCGGSSLGFAKRGVFVTCSNRVGRGWMSMDVDGRRWM